MGNLVNFGSFYSKDVDVYRVVLKNYLALYLKNALHHVLNLIFYFTTYNNQLAVVMPYTSTNTNTNPNLQP